MAWALLAQGRDTLICHTGAEEYEEIRPILATIAELVQNLEPIHIYKIQEQNLWQANALGLQIEEVVKRLRNHLNSPMPFEMQSFIIHTMERFGKLILYEAGTHRIILQGIDTLPKEIKNHPDLLSLAIEYRDQAIVLPEHARAHVKRFLVQHGWPVKDEIGYESTDIIEIELNNNCILRDYQKTAIEQFFDKLQNQSGVIVLPCGAGKTIVGIGILCRLKMHTLIVTPNETSACQWKTELFNKTTISEENVSIYKKGHTLTAITITTYPKVTAKTKQGMMKNLEALTKHRWALVIYDEVHMLPAPLFRLAADLQSARRLGLTATLVREDGLEHEVFSLIGSKCYEENWKTLENKGYLAKVNCVEILVELSQQQREKYEQSSVQRKHRIAADNMDKIEIIKKLIKIHSTESILIMGHYLGLLEQLAIVLQCPFIHGGTPEDERKQIFDQFRRHEITCLILSRVANLAIDLPNASIAIQISGLFGSRQEEAQRLGRILRPHSATGVFYTLVSRQTVEERMARHRQTFLVEQGYAYNIIDAVDLTVGRMTLNETVGMRDFG